MEKVFEYVLLPMLAAGVIGFYASAVLKPKIFGLLLRPVLFGLYGLVGLVFSYAVGAFFGAMNVLDALPQEARDANKAARDAMYEPIIPALWIAGICFVFLFLSLAFIPIANHQLREEAKEAAEKHNGG